MARSVVDDKETVQFQNHSQENNHGLDESDSDTSSDSDASVDSLRTDNKSTGRKPQQCRYCTKQYINSGGLWKHEKRCDKNENAKAAKNTNGNHNCQICKQSFRYSTGLAKHLKRHKGEGGFICKQCGAKFRSDPERKIHKETNHNVIKCQLCEMKFEKEDAFFKHINSEHDGRDRVYAICSDCGQQFRTNVQLKYHMESKCGTQKQWICEECNSRFMTKSTLRAHKLIHEGDKKHLCNYCGNSFLSKGQLKVHERSHTGEKPFICEICNKGFAYRESLVTHSSLHTGIKPYLCEGCGSRFSCIGNLIKHRKARPDSCGLPQFSTNTKVAPRPRAKRTRARRPRGTSKKMVIPETELNGTFQNNTVIVPKNENSDNVNTNQLPNLQNCEYTDYNFTNSESYTIENPFEANVNKDWNLENYEKPNLDQYGNFEPYLYQNGNATEILETKAEIELINCDGNEDSSQKLRSENCASKNSDILDHKNDIVINSTEILKCKKKSLKYKYHKREKNEKENIEATNENVRVENNSELKIKIEEAIKNTLVSEEICDKNDLIKESESIIINEKSKLPSMKNDNYITSDPTTTDFVGDLPVYDSDSSANQMPGTNLENRSQEEEKEESNMTLPTNIFYPTESKSGRPLFSCKFCLKEYAYLSALSKHEKTHEGTIKEASQQKTYKSLKNKESFNCKFCHKKYLSSSVLVKHEKEHGPDGNLLVRCTCCRKYFSTREKCLIHQARVHFERLTCTECNKIFKEPDNLTAHMKYTHGKGNVKKYTYVCPTCGKRFSSKLSLHDHELSLCGSRPMHSCPDCSRCYASAASLRAHRTVHSGALPHLCRYCGKAFRTRGQVKVHERGHSGEKPYACEFCPKAFAYRESLITHRSLHTGIKRHLCQGCGARFSCISNLQAHRKSHKNTCGFLTNTKLDEGPGS